MDASVDVAARPVDHANSNRSSSFTLSLCLNQYLQWLGQLHSTIGTVSDYAYILGRLLRQGGFPLRQRTGVVPTATDARLRAAVCELLIGDVAVQSVRPPEAIWVTSARTTRSGYTAANFSSAASSPPLVHPEAPFCPCRAYFEEHKRGSGGRFLSLRRRSSQAKDNDKESHTGHAVTISSASGSNDESDNRAVHLSAAVPNFPASSKNAVRGVNNLGSRDRFSSRDVVTSGKIRVGSRPSDALSQPILLLPVAVVTPSSTASAEFGNDALQANSGRDAQCRKCVSPENSDFSPPSPIRTFPRARWR
ncbi:hypothetical protein LPMP_340850 [Leishmania panamensis]|uniref:Uncharacterized protein n=1 Tax=Leishmania panamensis TaxID=5679 RepID=A0A088S0K1_LEIPA|nr:hypothetical protein LPMP_340850 [Leishmania panamensis]AIO01711.1 hypothetical protein LPMP_340850 [Leishmania panamensis]